jgi:hypothetical protein
MTTLFHNSIATIYYDQELDTLFLNYLSKVPNDEAFIKINTEVLNAFKRLNTNKFAVDLRKMGVISLTAQQWVVENLFPGMIQHVKGKRLYHAQLLDPTEIFSKVSASNIKNKSQALPETFDMEQFSNTEELRAKLLQLK